MRSAALMRLDTVSWKITTGVAAACVAWVIISFIIAVSGTFLAYYSQGSLQRRS